MNLVRLGRVVRALRRRRSWRQGDLAHRAVSSQQAVSLLECGHGDRLSIRTVARILNAVDAEVDVVVRWRGGELDRLLDDGHARLLGATAARLDHACWTSRAEITLR